MFKCIHLTTIYSNPGHTCSNIVKKGKKRRNGITNNATTRHTRQIEKDETTTRHLNKNCITPLRQIYLRFTSFYKPNALLVRVV